MGVVEFELVRVVQAPVEEVFARLADIEGHNAWMPRKGSILGGTQQTSPGEPGLGTTYLDKTRFGPTPGEVVEFDRPRTIVYHWWDRSRSGRLNAEGWPGYTLEAVGERETRVRHRARLVTYGAYRPATPVLGMIARRERTATLEALVASFDGATGAGRA
ncbi:SRPBCC family protein [Oryzobacter telluris]|uniref:SRPBCC family protein n=1 Tax=Oryzobacter telluris TaxID=3149179 RepID=UPI00370D98E5